MALKNVIRAVPLSVIDTASFGAGYIAFDALPAACTLIRIINDSDVGVTISYDGGTTEHDYVIAGKTAELDFQANNGPGNYPAGFPQGLIISANGDAGTGDVYLAAYYQPQGV